MKKLIICLLFLITIFPLASSLTLYPSVSPSTSYDYVFNLTENADCSGVILSATYTITTNDNGFGYVDIPMEAIGSQIPTYLCEYRSLTGDPVSLRKVHNFTEIIFKSVRSKSIITETINSSDWTNVTITESQISDLDHFTNSDETDPLWTANFTLYNDSWSSTYNSTYDSYISLNSSNNSYYLQGYTPTTLKDWIQTAFDTIYCELTGCTMTGDLTTTGTGTFGDATIGNGYTGNCINTIFVSGIATGCND